MTTCRTLDEVHAAGADDGRRDPPLSQDTADLVAAIRAPTLTPDQDGDAAA
jgi:hypothetical protein